MLPGLNLVLGAIGIGAISHACARARRRGCSAKPSSHLPACTRSHRWGARCVQAVKPTHGYSAMRFGRALQGSKNKQMHDTTSTHLAELRVHVEAVIQAKLAAHEQAVNGYGSYESAVFRHTRSARNTHMDACGHDFASTRVPPPVARVHSARRSACLTSVRRIALRHGLCRRT